MIGPSRFLHASIPYYRLSSLRIAHIFKFGNFCQSRYFGSEKGTISDVLEILGPPDCLFPSQNYDFHVGLLRKGTKTGNFRLATSVHGRLIKCGIDLEPSVGNVVLDMYAKLGILDECFKLFDEMPVTDVISWCTLIAGCVRHGFDLEAFRIFKRTCRSDVKINHFLVSSILNGCSSLGVVQFGIQVHGLIVRKGLGFDKFVEVGLVDMYAKCANLDSARKLFYEIPVKSLVSWNVMMTGYLQNGFLLDAIEHCLEMCRAGFIMGLVTLRIVTSVSSALEMLHLSWSLHAYSIKIGLNADNYVVTEHVKLLAKFGEVKYMKKLFAAVKKPNVSLFAVLISGFYYNDQRAEAVKSANKVMTLGFNSNEGLVVNILGICFYKEEGTQVHGRIMKNGHDKYVSVGNALISMYTKCGMIEAANATFHNISQRDEISWTAMMVCHVQFFQFSEALKLFCTFRKTSMYLDEYIFATTLTACTGLLAVAQGQQIHSLATKVGTTFSKYLFASLLHLYAKCGLVECATRLLSQMPFPHDLVPVNVMLAGFCWNLQPEQTIKLFHREHQMGFIPDKFSFSSLLGACSVLRSMEMGEQILCRICKSGLEASDIVVGNAIINFYMRSGNIRSMVKFFHNMKRFDSTTYYLVILGLTQSGNSKEAMKLLHQMHQSGFQLNYVALLCILRVCIDQSSLHLGKQLHAVVVKMGHKIDACVEDAFVEIHSRHLDTIEGDIGASDVLFEKRQLFLNSAITGSLADTEREYFLEYEAGYFEEMLQNGSNFDLNFIDRFVSKSTENRLFVSNGKYITGKDPLNLYERIRTKGIVSWKFINTQQKNKLANDPKSIY